MIQTFPNREAWIAWRYDRAAARIGASQIASICGFGYNDPYTEWARYMGVDMPTDPATEALLRHGHEDEPAIAHWAQEAIGVDLVDLGDHAVITNDEHPWRFCTLDRAIKIADGMYVPVELKSVYHSQKSWTDDAPLKYQAQLQWQMHCTGAPYGYIAARTQPEKLYRYEYNANFIRQAMAVIDRFRANVATGTPPQPSGSADDARAFVQLHPADNGAVIDLPDYEGLAHSLSALKSARDDAEVRYQKARQRIMIAMGDNTFAQCGDVAIKCATERTRKESITVDVKLEKALQIAGIKYTKTEEQTTRKLRVVKAIPKTKQREIA